MYLEHFQLKAAPFAISPDPRFFYPGGKYKKLLTVLHARLSQGCLCAFTGVKGVGKSVVIMQLCRKLGRQYTIIRLSRPDMMVENLLNYLVFELKLSDGLLESTAAEAQIQNWLAQEGAENRLVIMVENADKMPLASRQALSKLCDSPTAEGNQCSVLLCGSIALQGSLEASEGINLAASYALPRLNAKEVHDYLDYRVTKVGGYSAGELFDKALSKRIATLSDGIPRNIHLLADKVLCAALIAKAPLPTVDMLSETPSLEEITIDDLPAEQHGHEWFLALGCLVIVVCIYFWDVSETPDADSAPVVENVTGAEVLVEKDLIDEALALEKEQRFEPLAQVEPVEPVEPVEELVADSLVESLVVEVKPVDIELTPSETPISPLARSQQRLLAWLDSAPDSAGTIQLLLVRGGENTKINDYLVQLGESLDSGQLMTYSTVLNGQAYYGVLYQQYRSRGVAAKDVDNLPGAVQKLGPFIVRSAKGVKDEQGQI